MVKLSRWVPDSLMQRFLSKYNEDAQRSASEKQTLGDNQ
jgi:hypothetical protein